MDLKKKKANSGEIVCYLLELYRFSNNTENRTKNSLIIAKAY